MNITTMILSTSLSAIVLSGTAFAAESEASAPSLLGDHTDVTLGVAAQNAPRYRGVKSSNHGTACADGSAWPTLFRSFARYWLAIPVSFRFYLDHAIGYDMGRDDKTAIGVRVRTG